MGIRDLIRRLHSPLKNQRGVALMMAIFATSLMIFLAVEVSYDTNVEYMVASQQVNRLKAYYAAKAGAEMSLLRILIYKKAMAQFGEQLKGNEAMLDPIWQMPFAWPPIFPEDLSAVDKDLISGAVKNSSFDGQFLSTIVSEGGKIDINDLGSDIESLREATRQQLLTLFEGQRQNNEKFRDDNYGTDFNELLNNIADWVDEDDQSLNGGPESAEYPDIPSDSAEFIPPNTPFKTIEELNMVSGMTDEFYKILSARVTVFGVKGINVNYAPKEVLMSMAPTMTDEAVAEVLARRSDPNKGGPFVDDNDFLGFLESQRVDTQPIRDSKLPLYYGTVFNFRITSTGVFANVTREIDAIVYDLDNLKERYIEIVNKDEAEKNEGQDSEEEEASDPEGGSEKVDESPTSGSGSDSKINVPNGRPTVVYWKES